MELPIANDSMGIYGKHSALRIVTYIEAFSIILVLTTGKAYDRALYFSSIYERPPI